MKLQYPFFLAIFMLASFVSQSQTTGDTLIYQAFNYNSTTRDTVINLPNNPNLTFEKVIMLYSMRCKDGLVSTSSNRNRGCGEWDYSCNTYITDSAHVDSLSATHAKYAISGWSGTAFTYVTQPTYRRYQVVQPMATVASTISEDTAHLGLGITGVPMPIANWGTAGKQEMIFTQAELLAAGLSAGNITAMAFYLGGPAQSTKMLRVRIKATIDTLLNPGSPHLSGFTEVYYHNTALTLGINRLQFYTPFSWNGTSNLIVEVSFTNKTTTPIMVFQGDSVAPGTTLAAYDQASFDFTGANYIESNAYKGIIGTGNRTIEAWIKTTGNNQDIVYYGVAAAGQKYRLHIMPNGTLRMEVHTGLAQGTTIVNDGQWHHLAMVQYGPNTSQVRLYVDGVQETLSAVTPHAINTGTGPNVNITKGLHNAYFKGVIADVRIWSTDLSTAQIQEWRYRGVTPNHPAYNALELYYPLKQNTGSIITDESGKNRHASVKNGENWGQNYGVDMFKFWVMDWNRPKTTFYQGTYNLTLSQDTIIDTVANASNYVVEYAIYPKPGTVYTDSIGVVMQGHYWQALNDSLFAPNGTVISATPIAPAGTFTMASLPYWRRLPGKFEMTSFVTPYGIGLNLGIGGKTWAIDVTDFTPILKGKKRINMEWGGQWQEDIDIKFMFIVGTPPADVIDIQNIWRVSKNGYTQIMNETVFEPRLVKLMANAHHYKIRTAITGHGQEGEFIPRTHFMKLNNSNIASWQVWKECALNPVYPQGGTWIYDRAGWCPGMATDIREIDLSNQAVPGQTVLLDYGLNSASGTSEYIVSNQLVSYGPPNFVLDAAVVDIINPTDKIEHARTGSICNGPVVRVKNTGSTGISSLTITYWANNNPTPQVYSWSGNLAFGEATDVALPVGDLWDGLNGTPENTFHVEVSNPNGAADGYSHNNHMHSTFTLPVVFPNKIYLAYKSNLAPNETSYRVRDAQGNQVFSKTSFTANNLYYDTLDLADGCYTLQIDDTGDDGIAFWANNDGTGYFRIFNAATNARIFTVQPDFGKASTLAFTVNSPLRFEEYQQKVDCRIYPNPNNGRFVIEANGKKLQDWQLALLDVQGKVLWSDEVKGQRELLLTPDFSPLPSGIYLLHIKTDAGNTVQKIVVE